MLKISNKHSINLSLTIAVLFFVICIAGAFILPALVPMLIDARDNIGSRGDITQAGGAFVMIISYLMLAVFVAADALLFKLLLNVKKELVFTEQSVALIRGVSWCCFAVCLLLCGLGIYFQLAFVAAFMGLFLGLCLRVTKNVIAEATEIKSENDLTV